MRSSPKVFDSLYVNMVEAGETGGILDTILQRLSTYIEKNVKLQRAVKSALVYPVGVLTVAGGVITLLLWKVVPRCLRALAWISRCPRKSSSLSVILSAAFSVCSCSWPSGAPPLV
jgi:type II secretory pathway component PulF